LGLLFANLAMYANFSVLLFVLITFGILALNIILNKNYYFKQKQIIQLFTILILFILSIFYTLKVLFFYKELDILWWGYLNGFWEDTIISLIDLFFRTESYNFLIQIAIAVLTLFSLVISLINRRLYYIFNKNNKKYYDYIIDEKERMGDAIIFYDSIDNQKYTDINLYKRKSSIKLNLIDEFSKKDFNGERDKDFGFCRFSTDTLNSSTLFFDLEIEIDFKEFPLYTYLVFVVENKETEKKYGYKFFDMDRKTDWKKSEKFSISEIISNIPKNEKVEIAVYFWNRYKVKHELYSCKLGVYEVLE